MKFASRTALPTVFSNRLGFREPIPAPRRRRPLAAAVAPALTGRRTPEGACVGKSFGRKRIEHAVEVAGACIMLAMFLMLALLA